jgi:hypothetical protein
MAGFLLAFDIWFNRCCPTDNGLFYGNKQFVLDKKGEALIKAQQILSSLSQLLAP